MGRIFCLFGLGTALMTATAAGQGSLTPPGAPAPTMKTLDQIEARKAIPGGTSPFTISSSGSYYLTGNITVASGDVITINASNVTLDLNGYTIATTSATSSGTGILVKTGAVRVTVCNGFIVGTGTTTAGSYSGGGFINGLAAEGAQVDSVIVHDLEVSGCSTMGIGLGNAGGNIAERCMVKNTGTLAISCEIVRSCRVSTAGGAGVEGKSVSDSVVNAWTTGINAGQVLNSQAGSNTGTAISCIGAQNCYASSTSGAGLVATNATNCIGGSGGNHNGVDATTAIGCKGSSTGAYGVLAVNAQGCTGISTTSIGLQTGTGTDCAGQTDTGGLGMYGNVLTNCQGVALNGGGGGLQAAFSATTCIGLCNGGIGLQSRIATGCMGGSTVGQYGIFVTVSIGCYTSDASELFANFRYNTP